MRKEVDLCDNCEESIAKGKCAACGSDVCNMCAYMVGIVSQNITYNVVMKIVKYSMKSGNPEKHRDKGPIIEEVIS